jgi:DNA-binding LytR/AlgR family response regulator
MIRCLTIDDAPLALAQLNNFVSRVPFFELAGSATNAFEAMEILAKTKVDLIYTDIDMPDLNGLDFVKSVAQKPMIIFSTAYSEYAIEGFKIEAIDYLLKPYSFNEFLKSANKALEVFEFKNHPDSSQKKEKLTHIFIKADYKIVNIPLDKLEFIQSQGDYAKFYVEGSKPYMSLMSMKFLEELLQNTLIVRVHRSFFVNIKKISYIANQIIIIGSNQIPLGDSYKASFLECIQQNGI